MSKSYATLNTIIVDKLKALLDGAGATIFVDVYNVAESKPEGYPCAFVTEAAGEGSLLDTARNEREWQFEVALMQENSKKTPEEAAVIMRIIADDVIDMFDQDPQLRDAGGAHQCMYAKVAPLLFDYTIRESPAIFARFLISVVDIVNNF